MTKQTPLGLRGRAGGAGRPGRVPRVRPRPLHHRGDDQRLRRLPHVLGEGDRNAARRGGMRRAADRAGERRDPRRLGRGSRREAEHRRHLHRRLLAARDVALERPGAHADARALRAATASGSASAIGSTPMCCPARGNLLTGRYGHRTGHHPQRHGPIRPCGVAGCPAARAPAITPRMSASTSTGSPTTSRRGGRWLPRPWAGTTSTSSGRTRAPSTTIAGTRSRRRASMARQRTTTPRSWPRVRRPAISATRPRTSRSSWSCRSSTAIRRTCRCGGSRATGHAATCGRGAGPRSTRRTCPTSLAYVRRTERLRTGSFDLRSAAARRR